MPEPTKGPWRASQSREGQSWSVLNEHRRIIAKTFESEANARRMAAAPETFEALVGMVEFVDPNKTLPLEDMPALARAYTAIAKATGEPYRPPERSYDDLGPSELNDINP